MKPMRQNSATPCFRRRANYAIGPPGIQTVAPSVLSNQAPAAPERLPEQPRHAAPLFEFGSNRSCRQCHLTSYPDEITLPSFRAFQNCNLTIDQNPVLIQPHAFLGLSGVDVPLLKITSVNVLAGLVCFLALKA